MAGGDAFIIGLAKRKPGARFVGSVDKGGGGSGSGKSRDNAKDEPKDDYSEVEQSALDDLAEILQVDDADRERFDSAMEDLIEACAKRAIDEESKTEDAAA